MSEQRFIVPQHQCEHGQLARVCNICELQARVKELELALDSVTAQRDELLSYNIEHHVWCGWSPGYAACNCGRDDLIAKIEASRSGVNAERKS